MCLRSSCGVLGLRIGSSPRLSSMVLGAGAEEGVGDATSYDAPWTSALSRSTWSSPWRHGGLLLRRLTVQEPSLPFEHTAGVIDAHLLAQIRVGGHYNCRTAVPPPAVKELSVVRG